MVSFSSSLQFVILPSEKKRDAEVAAQYGRALLEQNAVLSGLLPYFIRAYRDFRGNTFHVTKGGGIRTPTEICTKDPIHRVRLDCFSSFLCRKMN
jgi:hypothetical protein